MTWEEGGAGGSEPPKPEHVLDVPRARLSLVALARQQSPTPFHRAMDQLARERKHADGLLVVLCCMETCRTLRLLKRLHVRGLIAKVPHTRRWQVTSHGHKIWGACVRLYDHGLSTAAECGVNLRARRREVLP